MKLKKFFKNRKGFTLIELMMVIAVIGILAAVLVPKMGNVKTNAKMAGVDTNVRQVQAAVVGMIQRYQSGATAANFSSAVAASCAGLVNPLDSGDVDGAVEGAEVGFVDAKAVTVAKASGGTAAAANAANAGRIFVTYAITNNAVDTVTITPYDNAGSPMAPELFPINWTV